MNKESVKRGNTLLLALEGQYGNGDNKTNLVDAFTDVVLADRSLNSEMHAIAHSVENHVIAETDDRDQAFKDWVTTFNDEIKPLRGKEGSETQAELIAYDEAYYDHLIELHNIVSATQI